MRSRALMIWLVVAGCGEQFDPCDPGETIDIIGPANVETWSGTVLAVDHEGYALFYGEDASVGGDVWAVRPGNERVRVWRADAPTGWAVIAVTNGFLFCWSSPPTVDDPSPGECFTLDANFRRIGSATDVEFPIADVGRVGDVIIATTRDAGRDMLFAIDDDGNPLSSPVPWPCDYAGAFTWAPEGVACLLPSDPLCGDQFNEPPSCVYDLHVFDVAAQQQLFVPGVAPYGAYSEWIDVEVAARADGYMASWIDQDGWHAQPIDATGLPGVRFDYQFSALRGSALFSTDTGYVGVFPEPSQGFELPRVLRFDPAGTPGTPEWVTDPGGGLTRQYAYTAMVASRNGGVGVAWTGAGGDDATDYRAGLRFRSLGCQ